MLGLKLNHISNRNPLKPALTCCHFADDIFKCIFLNENFFIFIKIPFNFISKGQIDKPSRMGSGNGLVPNAETNRDLIYGCIYIKFNASDAETRIFQNN